VNEEVGVPQGSPISKVLFMIYLSPFHDVPLLNGISLNYLDDIALTKGSKLY